MCDAAFYANLLNLSPEQQLELSARPLKRDLGGARCSVQPLFEELLAKSERKWKQKGKRHRTEWIALVKSMAVAVWHRKVVRYSRADKTAEDRRLLDVIDAAERAGLLVNVRSRPGLPGVSSRLIPTSRLLDELPSDPRYFVSQVHPVVTLRERGQGPEIPIEIATAARRNRGWTSDAGSSVADQTQAMLEFINKVNGYYRVSALRGDLPGGPARRILSTRQHAVFSGSFELGGRVYTNALGHQGLRKKDRATIEFDGPFDKKGRHLGRFQDEPACEVDFGCCHPRMLYHLCGVRLGPNADIYWLWDEAFDKNNNQHAARRKLLKKIVNISLNAGGGSDEPKKRVAKAIQTCKRQLLNKDPDGRPKMGTEAGKAEDMRRWLRTAGLTIDQLMKLLIAKHPALVDHFCTDIGIRLQRIDGNIALLVMHEFVRQGIPALSMHDALIVPDSYATKLRLEMASNYAYTMGALGRPGTDPLVDGMAAPGDGTHYEVSLAQPTAFPDKLKNIASAFDLSSYLER